MVKRYLAHIFSLLALALILSGCTPKKQNICHVNPRNWSQSADLSFDNIDTDTKLDISFFVRYNADFAIQPLPIIIRTEAPDSSVSSEQVLWVFDSERATSPTASIQKIGYRKGCRLNQQGKYTFSLTPQTSVRGIEAVGLIIEQQS